MISFFKPKIAPLETNPYILDIESAQIYSNFGPVVQKLESALGNHFESGPESIITVNNGTMGLMGMLACGNLPKNANILIPSYTFAATALAIQHCGYNVIYADVDAKTWALTPKIAQKYIKNHNIHAVMPVYPFGAPLDINDWENFQDTTQIPVFIDAAAGFANVTPSNIPQMVSLHPTKILPSCEGGFVISKDADFNDRLRKWTNFGFDNDRTAHIPGINAKMNEYTAAIALKSLIDWPETIEKYELLSKIFQTYVADIDGVDYQHGFGDAWLTASPVLKLENETADIVMDALNTRHVPSRKWWSKPCHHHPALAQNVDLPVTEHLDKSTFSIPFHIFLSPEHIDFMFQNLFHVMEHMKGDQKPLDDVRENVHPVPPKTTTTPMGESPSFGMD